MSGFESFDLWSFRISSRSGSDRVGFQVISGSRSRSGRVSDRLISGHLGFFGSSRISSSDHLSSDFESVFGIRSSRFQVRIGSSRSDFKLSDLELSRIISRSDPNQIRFRSI
jgi:hypothetical protein